mgnify:CR=1 FL=1
MKERHLILFFTYGISLKIWDETGLLDREIVLYKKLIKNGFKVCFITYGDESDYHYQDKLGEIKIIPFYAFVKKPSNRILKFIQSFFLPVFLRNQLKEADIIKTNQMSTTWVPIFAKYMFKKKLVIRCGFEWYRSFIRLSNSKFIKIYLFVTELLSYNLADAIIMTSHSDREYIIKKFKIKKEKIAVIHNYVNTNFFIPLKIPKKENHLIFIGRLSYPKNLFNLLEALKGSYYTLDMIGDGELKPDLEKYALENNICVNFLGRFPNSKIPELLNQYEVFILPSYWEGNPKSLLEAMSCGLAIIGTDVDGINNIIRHKENGYLCKTDSKSIREAIDAVMADELLRKRMGTQAREFIIRNCSIEEIIKKEIAIYNRLYEKVF